MMGISLVRSSAILNLSRLKHEENEQTIIVVVAAHSYEILIAGE